MKLICLMIRGNIDAKVIVHVPNTVAKQAMDIKK